VTEKERVERWGEARDAVRRKREVWKRLVFSKSRGSSDEFTMHRLVKDPDIEEARKQMLLAAMIQLALSGQEFRSDAEFVRAAHKIAHNPQ
jgi:hypothetical protein